MKSDKLIALVIFLAGLTVFFALIFTGSKVSHGQEIEGVSVSPEGSAINASSSPAKTIMDFIKDPLAKQQIEKERSETFLLMENYAKALSRCGSN